MFQAEETVVNRLLAETIEMLEKPLTIIGADRADMSQAAVAECFVNLIIRRIQKEPRNPQVRS
jgi:hypothetical protein